MSYDIKDKVIFITGANRGIGKVMVDTFIANGVAKVYAAVRKLETVKPLVEQYGGQVVPIYIDLGQPESIKEAASKALDTEVVINNAGVLKVSSPLATDAIDALKFEMEINVYGLINMAQAFAPILKNNGGGVFAQLNSIVSMKSFSNFATYSASKAAAYSLSQALRELFEDQGTIMLSVHPGPIATDMGEEAGLTAIAESPNLVPEGIISALKAGEFHVFPDSMAKQIWSAYEGFAKNVVETRMTEG